MPAHKRVQRCYRYEMGVGSVDAGEVSASSPARAWEKLPWDKWPLGEYQVRLFVEVETVQVVTRKQPTLTGSEGHREVQVRPDDKEEEEVEGGC